ncbi:cytochrome b/b6 domain-containing protein [Lacimicrobium alkaliphilum]|uniref:Cytochrome b561 n=1 Tax=Lacimicrobium alkaliphilum TaxID=1526571 RepID=A0ABQ1RBN7_9ALTE|nr:cytochrome b/b6 domain-containing protein [Lacimicrobium alkaliphilum]GGD65070.1 cytochrome b561 [Lacimicrobium alkaliphilum]
MAAAKAYVWSVPVRLAHWTFAGIFVCNYFILDPGSDSHQVLGYVALSLVALRLFYGLFSKGYAGFNRVDISSRAIGKHVHHLRQRRLPLEEGHNPMGWLMVFVMLGLFISLAVTGYLLEETHRFFGSELVERIHSLLADALFICVCLHIAAVILIGHIGNVSLVKSMITGYRNHTSSPDNPPHQD